MKTLKIHFILIISFIFLAHQEVISPLKNACKPGDVIYEVDGTCLWKGYGTNENPSAPPTWDDANAKCQATSIGGDGTLVTIPSAEKNTVVAQLCDENCYIGLTIAGELPKVKAPGCDLPFGCQKEYQCPAGDEHWIWAAGSNLAITVYKFFLDYKPGRNEQTDCGRTSPKTDYYMNSGIGDWHSIESGGNVNINIPAGVCQAPFYQSQEFFTAISITKEVFVCQDIIRVNAGDQYFKLAKNEDQSKKLRLFDIGTYEEGETFDLEKFNYFLCQPKLGSSPSHESQIDAVLDVGSGESDTKY